MRCIFHWAAWSGRILPLGKQHQRSWLWREFGGAQSVLQTPGHAPLCPSTLGVLLSLLLHPWVPAPLRPCCLAKGGFRGWILGMVLLLRVKRGTCRGTRASPRSLLWGRHLPQPKHTEPFPSQELKQSRGDLFQCPRGTRQGPREPAPAPVEPRLHVWHVCLSLRCALTPWLPITGRFAGARGSQAVLGRGSWTGFVPKWLRGCSHFCCWHIRAHPSALPWLLLAASFSSLNKYNW